MWISELSKALMYKFHYDYIKNTDAHSLIYENKTEDVYKDISSDKEMFNFSNY